MGGFGEILPYHENHVTLDRTRKDKHGLPLLAFDAGLKENELRMRKDMANDAAEMLEAAGYRDVKVARQQDRRRPGHPRDGRRAHGPRSENIGAQRLEPGARVQERVRDRRRVHGLGRVPEPVAHLHGADRARGQSRRRRTQAPQHLRIETMNRREALQRAAWLMGGALSAPLTLDVLDAYAARRRRTGSRAVLSKQQADLISRRRRHHDSAHDDAGREGCRRHRTHRRAAQGCLFEDTIANAICPASPNSTKPRTQATDEPFLALDAKQQSTLVHKFHDEAAAAERRLEKSDEDDDDDSPSSGRSS